MADPFRADHVGSLLRPAEILEAHDAYTQNRITLDQVREIEDRAIIAAIDLQRQVGLDVFSDGEYRRRSWAGDFGEAVEGYVPGAAPVAMQWGGSEARPSTGVRPAGAGGRVVGEKLRQVRRLTAHESGFLKEQTPGPWKVTLPAASYMVARGFKPGITDKVYPTRADLLRDVVAIIKSEIKALADEGVPYIQLDNPHYPDYIDESRRAQWQEMGIDPEQSLAEDIAADNECLEGIDRSRLTLATHICRGNSRSAWHTAGAYDRIAEQVFGRLEYDRFLLEYDDERSGGFEPLRFMPNGRIVVLGLITTKAGALESQELLRQRIEEAAKYVPLENLTLSPQCGFASVAEGNLLTWDDQRRKLELVVDTARKVWG